MIFTLVSLIFIGSAVTRMRTLAPRLARACDCLPIAKFAAREERASKAGVDDRVSSVYNLRASMNVERSRVYAYFMFVVEAMLRYVTFRLSSRDVSSQAFPVFNVSRPRTIKRSQVKRRNGEGLEPRLRTCVALRLYHSVEVVAIH